MNQDMNDQNPKNDEIISMIPSQDEADDIIQVRNVHKTYLLGLEGVTALRGVSFSVKRGEFIVILGTSGCGKTTLLNILGSIDLPTKGDVTICGNIIKASTEDKILAGLRLSYLGFVFQQFNLIQSLTALENVELPMTLKGDHNKDYIKKRAIELLNKVGLSERINHFPNQLSGGEQQRVTIARALSNSPSILLLDEPTGDLDTKNSDLIMDTIINLNLKEDITIIMVTHDTFLKNFATKTIKMLDGKIQKLEQNEYNNRELHIQKLKQIIQSYDMNNQVEEKKQNDLGVRSGALEESSNKFSKTERRVPSDYAALSYKALMNNNNKNHNQIEIQQKQPTINQEFPKKTLPQIDHQQYHIKIDPQYQQFNIQHKHSLDL